MPQLKKGYTFGFDVEFALVEVAGVRSKVVLAPEVCTYSKENPAILGNGWKYHYDNVFFEVATPVLRSVDCLDNINLGMFVTLVREQSEELAQMGTGKSLCVIPTVKVTADDEDRCPAITVFGCVPDYNPYTRDVNPSPSMEAARGLRTAGGHIHFGFEDPKAAGFDPENDECYYALAKAFDCFVGLPLKQNNLLCTARRELYGRAGAFRFKKEYPGIEYRVPSNEWVGVSDPRRLASVQLYKVANCWSLFMRPDFQSLAEDVADFINAPDGTEVPHRGDILFSYVRSL